MRFAPSGLGYRASLVDEGIEMAVDRLVESRGEMSGELTVSRTGEGHLMQARFNLSSITARNSTAKYLGARSNSVSWDKVLETFSLQVIRSERAARPAVVLSRRAPAPPTMALDPLLFEGGPTLLFGEEGTGKSTLAAAVAVSLAGGQSIFVPWSVPRQTNVLILDWEADEEDWINMVAGLCVGARITMPDVHYRACAPSLRSDVNNIARICSDLNIGFVIIDSMGMALSSSREGTSEGDRVIELFTALRYLGVTALILDHVAKAPGFGTHRAIGSVYKGARARKTYELRGTSGDTGDTHQHLGLFNPKVNKTAKDRPQGIRIERDADGGIRLCPEDVRDDANLMAGLSIPERVARYLENEGRSTVDEIAEGVGVPQVQVRMVLNRAKDRFVSLGVVEGGKSKVWALSADREEET